MASEESIEKSSESMMKKCFARKSDFEEGIVDLSYRRKGQTMSLICVILSMEEEKVMKLAAHIAKEGVVMEPAVLLCPDRRVDSAEAMKRKAISYCGVTALGVMAKDCGVKSYESFRRKLAILLGAFEPPFSAAMDSICASIRMRLFYRYGEINRNRKASF